MRYMLSSRSGAEVQVGEAGELDEYRAYVKKRLDAIARIGISASEGNFVDAPDSDEVDDEFAQIYTGIKVMVEALQHQVGAFQELNRSLEAKIEARTLELSKSEAGHRAAAERYALAAAGTNEGLWDWSLETGEIYYSLRWSTILGLRPDEVGRDSDEWFSRVHAEDLVGLLGAIYDHIEGTTPFFEFEHRMQHRDGRWVWVHSRGIALQENGRPFRMAGSITDITVRKHAERALLHNAFHDSLTGLPNRALLLDRLHHSLKKAARRQAKSSAVLFIDVDHFKVVNDSLGHAAGDQLLIALGLRLESCIRPGDTLARFGGDEFVILLEDVAEASGTIVVARRILESMKAPFEIEGQPVFASVSIGIVPRSSGYDKPGDILRDADAAAYSAKSLGRAGFRMFEPGLRRNAVSRLSLDRDLRQAVDRSLFCVYYQPIVSLADSSLKGFEALIRWNHPVRGLIPPAEFIPLAEETGLILPMGRFVIEESLRQLSEWNKAFGRSFYMHVNLSARQFEQADLPGTVRNAIEKQNTPGGLVLEITESVLMRNPEGAVRTLQELRAMGASLALDDFGTGYSSLSYLRTFPIDSIKIDRSFVEPLGRDRRNGEIVRSVVALARTLGLEAVAEGIEDPLQAEFLASLGCPMGQGYYYSAPLGADQAGAALDVMRNTGVWTPRYPGSG